LLCEPLETTANGKRLVVEDSAACQKTIQTPVAQQVLKTDGAGNLTWTNGASGTILRKDATGLVEFATLNSVLQSGPVDLGSQPLTTTGAVSVGSLASTGAITAKTIDVTNTGTGNGISIQTENGIPFSIQSSKTNPIAGGTLNFFGATADMEFNGASDGAFVFFNSSTETTKATVFNGANVGIYTLTPTQALDVNGKIKSKNETIINGATSEFKLISLTTNNLTRWNIGSTDTAESGSNVGSDFFINRFTDAGAYLGTSMQIVRSTGNVGIGTASPAKTLHVNGTVRLQGLPTYANNAAAITGGLVADDVYKTSTGELRIVV
jgi:hypothetical protein